MRFGGLIAAIVVAAIAAIFVFRMSANDTPPPATTQQAAPQMKTVNIYVAARAIPIGSTITQEMIAIQPWPEHLVLPGFILANGGGDQTIASKALGDKPATDVTAVVGTVARAPFQAQEPIIKSKLANPSDPNFLAGGLPKGMRVITITTNETEGLAGFVFPGDHVDVILTHDVDKEVVKNGAKSTVQESITETVLNNVTVLAVDQRASGTDATDKDGKLIIPRSVSLMVSPTDAQRIRLGQKLGTLTLSLRSLADRESADPVTLTAPTDVSQYKDTPQSVDMMTIYRGVTKESTDIGQPAATGPAQPRANILVIAPRSGQQ